MALVSGDIGGIQLDSRQFDQSIFDLARITGKTFQKILKSEAGSILSKAMKDTGSASVSNITAHYTYKDPGTNETTIPFVRLNGKKVRVRSIRKRGMLVNGRWDPKKNNPLWKPLQDTLKRLMKRAKARRGLSKATWLLVSRDIKGMPPIKSVPKYVTKSYNRIGGGVRRAVSGKESGNEDYHITIKNKSYTAMAPGSHGGPNGYWAFKGAMIGRFLYFQKNLQKRVFNKTSEIVKKYPGFMTSSG